MRGLRAHMMADVAATWPLQVGVRQAGACINTPCLSYPLLPLPLLAAPSRAWTLSKVCPLPAAWATSRRPWWGSAAR